MDAAQTVQRELQRYASSKKAASSARFFQTGKGDYAETDRFIGVTVPEQRVVAKKFRDLELAEVRKLLRSSVHEHRLTAIIILTLQFPKADTANQERIVHFALANTRHINNWDLVDTLAPGVLGSYCLKKPRSLLYRLARSKNLWERRLAIVATQELIRAGEFSDTLKLAKLLLKDPHPLIHKAVGWMLREVGNKDKRTEETFLKQYARAMPRTMLRYAIEKFPPKVRARYLHA